MARVTTEQARKISNNTSSGYFSLKNDGEKAKVKFMYNGMDEIETYAVHEVKVNGFNRHVDCLKDSEGNGVCPFCEKGVKLTARTFFKLYDADKDSVVIWDCGLKKAPMIENILKMCEGKLVNYCFEITRHGKPNDTQTTYDISKVGKDDITLEDLPQAPELYGRYVMKKTAEEMEYYITNNEFPKEEKQQQSSQNTEVKKRVNRMAF